MAISCAAVPEDAADVLGGEAVPGLEDDLKRHLEACRACGRCQDGLEGVLEGSQSPVGKLGEQAALLEVLTAHAVAGPGGYLEPFRRDLRSALLANAVITPPDPLQSFIDLEQLLPLEIAQR